MVRSPLRVAAFAVGALAPGCSDTVTERVDPVIGGTFTYAHPEVGLLSVGCTATLVSPDVGITAAHCFGYRSRTTPGRWATFTVQHDEARQYRYTVEQYISYSSRLGRDDLALFRLDTSVPAAVARPASLAPVAPTTGATLTVYGYGCTARGYGSDFLKRRRSFLQGERTAALCPGDSGGPVLTADNGVLRVNSGYYYSGSDIFGEVPPSYDRLRAQVNTWTRGATDPGPGPEPRPDPPPAPRPDSPPAPPSDPCASRASACGGCTPIPGCGWCGATSRCISVDHYGRPLTACASGFALNPPDCADPSTDRCGIYAPFPEYTCRRAGTGFARCVPGGEPEFLVCPAGATCTPGSRVLWCYYR